MSKEKELRAKRGDIYSRYKPNTAIWIGRLVPLIACICVLLVFIMRKYDLPFDWSKDVLSLRGSELLLLIPAGLIYVLAFVGFFKSGELKGGMFNLGVGYSFDEFEQRLVERSRLYSFRALAIVLIVPTVAILMRLPADVFLSEPLQGIAELALFLCVLIVFTMPAAVYHWSLKLVPEEENIHPILDAQPEVTLLENS